MPYPIGNRDRESERGENGLPKLRRRFGRSQMQTALHAARLRLRRDLRRVLKRWQLQRMVATARRAAMG